MVRGLTPTESSKDAPIDVLLLLEQSAERLTSPHVRLLLIIEANPQELINGSPGGPVGISDDSLAAKRPEAAAVIAPHRLTLEREGLIRDVNSGTYDDIQRW